jgi:hypothetical protein
MTQRLRRKFLRHCAAAALLGAVRIPAQAQTSQARIGILAVSSQEAARPSVDAFKKRLQELGYAEGQNVRYVNVLPTATFTSCAAWLMSW